MQHLGRAHRCAAGIILITCTITSRASADLSYPNFNTTTGLTLNHSATATAGKLRLTNNQLNQVGSAYGSARQRVADGFTTQFLFQITGVTGDFPDDNGQVGGDGFSFIVQNQSVNAIGGGGNAIGYGGITNSLAIEFDTFWNTARIFPTGDPNGNHVSIQTNGTGANSADHAFSRGQAALASPDFSDGLIHAARIDYTPGQFRIYIDQFTQPVLDVSDPSLNLANAAGVERGERRVCRVHRRDGRRGAGKSRRVELVVHVRPRAGVGARAAAADPRDQCTTILRTSGERASPSIVGRIVTIYVPGPAKVCFSHAGSLTPAYARMN